MFSLAREQRFVKSKDMTNTGPAALTFGCWGDRKAIDVVGDPVLFLLSTQLCQMLLLSNLDILIRPSYRVVLVILERVTRNGPGETARE